MHYLSFNTVLSFLQHTGLMLWTFENGLSKNLQKRFGQNLDSSEIWDFQGNIQTVITSLFLKMES